MKKQILSLLTLCAVMLNITACSGEENTVSSTDSAADNSQISEAVSLPESLPESTDNSEAAEKQGAYYDDVFKDIIEEIPTSGAPMTYDDIMRVMTDYRQGGLDSYYLVETIGMLNLSDCEKLRGFEDWYHRVNGIEYDGIHYGLNVIYKVRAIKDLITGEECNKELYIALSSNNPVYQSAGDPPYAPGEKFTVALFNKADDCDITQSGAGYFFRFDVDGSDNSMALVRSNSDICASGVVEVTKISEKNITSTTANPARYIAKFKLSDFVDFLRGDWEERKVSHFEEAEN